MKRLGKSTSDVTTFGAVMVLWLIISTTYIVHDLWQSGVSATYQAGFQVGVQNAFAQVVQQSQQCEPFNIFVGEARADLINVACLQGPDQAGVEGGERAVETEN